MMVSLYRSEPGGRFHYVSLTGAQRSTLVVREVTIAASRHSIISNDELYVKCQSFAELDRTLTSLVAARLADGYQIIHTHLPAERLPRSARLVLPPGAPKSALSEWITFYLLPSSES